VWNSDANGILTVSFPQPPDIEKQTSWKEKKILINGLSTPQIGFVDNRWELSLKRGKNPPYQY